MVARVRHRVDAAWPGSQTTVFQDGGIDGFSKLQDIARRCPCDKLLGGFLRRSEHSNCTASKGIATDHLKVNVPIVVACRRNEVYRRAVIVKGCALLAAQEGEETGGGKRELEFGKLDAADLSRNRLDCWPLRAKITMMRYAQEAG